MWEQNFPESAVRFSHRDVKTWLSWTSCQPLAQHWDSLQSLQRNLDWNLVPLLYLLHRRRWQNLWGISQRLGSGTARRFLGATLNQTSATPELLSGGHSHDFIGVYCVLFGGSGAANSGGAANSCGAAFPLSTFRVVWSGRWSWHDDVGGSSRCLYLL